MWTEFMDMHSGGRTKIQPYERIFIEASENEAKAIFINRFQRDPDNISCGCCGQDYSTSSGEDLRYITAFDRHCEAIFLRPDGSECSRDEAFLPGKGFNPGYTENYAERQGSRLMDIRTECETEPQNPWGLYIALEDYIKRDDVLFIHVNPAPLPEESE